MKNTRLIGFEKKKLKSNRELDPSLGSHGRCRLCDRFEKLSDSHVLPQSVGNKGAWLADGYLSRLEGKQAQYRKRPFHHGISFKTTCESCNNTLGRNEDIELLRLYKNIIGLLKSPILLPNTINMKIRINKIMKGILYYIATANDRCPPTLTDRAATDVHEGRKHIGEIPYFFYIWIYRGSSHCLIRDFHCENLQSHTRFSADVLKLAPLGFAISDSPDLRGMTPLNKYISSNDDTEIDLPFPFYWQEYQDFWPAVVFDKEFSLRSEQSMGQLSRRR